MNWIGDVFFFRPSLSIPFFWPLTCKADVIYYRVIGLSFVTIQISTTKYVAFFKYHNYHCPTWACRNPLYFCQNNDHVCVSKLSNIYMFFFFLNYSKSKIFGKLNNLIGDSFTLFPPSYYPFMPFPCFSAFLYFIFHMAPPMSLS